MKKFFVQLFHDVDGIPSSKRVVVFLCVIFFFVIAAANLFYGLKVDENIYSTIRDITLAGIGFSGAEKFSKRPAQGVEG